MPGLIDAHTHIMFATVPQRVVLTSDIGFVNVAAGKAATDMLMRGFTSIRDLGGPVFGLKRGIDEGLVAGPRIWPAGRDDLADRRPRRLPAAERAARARRATSRYSERIGAAAIADERRHGAPARARAAGARRVADQADGRRRRGVELRPARRDAVHRAPSCGPRWRRPRTGAPTSPCTPTRRAPCGRPSRPA